MESGVRTPFKDSEGSPYVGLLTAYGNAINGSDANTKGRYVASGDSPTYTRLRIYRELDFNSLGII
jgi:hypothetical protein